MQDASPTVRPTIPPPRRDEPMSRPYSGAAGPVDHFKAFQEPPTVDNGGKFDDGIQERAPRPGEHLKGARSRVRK